MEDDGRRWKTMMIPYPGLMLAKPQHLKLKLSRCKNAPNRGDFGTFRKVKMKAF